MFWTGSKFNNTGDNFTSNIFSGFHFSPVGLAWFSVLYPSKNRTRERLACKKEIYLDLMFCKYLQLFHRYLGRCQSLGQHAKLKSVYTVTKWFPPPVVLVFLIFSVLKHGTTHEIFVLTRNFCFRNFRKSLRCLITKITWSQCSVIQRYSILVSLGLRVIINQKLWVSFLV